MLQYTQITALISELLYKHDCVIIPDFGGFVARHYSANFSKGNNLLFPATKHVLFNKNLVHQDGLLVTGLMEKNAIPFAEATRLIEDYKEYIESLLDVKKRFELPGLGLLYMDSENSLRFEAKADLNFLLDSFGLEPLVANELLTEVETPLITKLFEDRKATEDTSSRRQKRSYAKMATLAVGLPATLAFLLFAAYSKPMKPILQSSLNPFYTPEKTYTPDKAKSASYFINSPTPQPLLADPNGYATFRLSETGPVLVASVDSIAPTDHTYVKKVIHVSQRTIESYGKFKVVVGCFSVEENAYKLAKELRKNYTGAGVIGKNANGLHVVSCGSFNAKDEAAALLATLKENFPNAWIMTK